MSDKKVISQLQQEIKSLEQELSLFKERESSARKNIDFCNSILEAFPFGIDIVDEHASLLYISKNLETVFGKKALGKRCWDLYKDNATQCEHCPLKSGINPGETATLETEGVFGGKTFQIFHTGMIYEGKKAILEIFFDITEKKKLERDLQVSETKFKTLAETSPDCIKLFDLNGNLIYMSPGGLREHWLKSLEEAIGWDYLASLTPAYRPVLTAAFDDAKKGKTTTFEVEHTPEGADRDWCLMTLTPVRGMNGEISGIFGVSRDITRQKETQAALEKAKSHLTEWNRLLDKEVKKRTKELQDSQEKVFRTEKLAALGQLAGSIAHELRNPIHVIGNGLLLLDLELKKDKSCRENMALHRTLRILDEQVHQAMTIVGNILSFGRIKKPLLNSADSMTVLTDILKDIKVPESVTISMQGIDVLPLILIDVMQIKLVFTNIISNAIQAMPAGGSVMIRGKKDKDKVCISISDTGEGIKKADLPKIFEPLFSTKAKGTGLGLPVCKSIVEGHKGSILVESTREKGTTFTIELPEKQ